MNREQELLQTLDQINEGSKSKTEQTTKKMEQFYNLLESMDSDELALAKQQVKRISELHEAKKKQIEDHFNIQREEQTKSDEDYYKGLKF